MNNLMTSSLILAALSSVTIAEPASRPVEQPVAQKKLIEFGWDEPDTAFMRKHTAQMDATPFDGCVYHVRYLQPDGRDADFIWSCWGRRAFTIEQVRHAIDDLKATRFKRLRHNFLRFNVTPGDLDWFDDYSAVVNNARLAARVAREGGIGILFDTEMYHAPLFDYRKQPGSSSRTWEQYAVQARKRGREVMQAFQEEFPGLKVLMTFGYGAPWQESDAGKKPLSECAYGLLSPFLDGMIDAAEGGSQLIDGWESAYSYFEEKKFRKARKMIHQDVLAMVADRDKYRKVFSASFGMWLDYRAKEEGWNVEHPERNPWPPEKFERMLGIALQYADEYVWIYSETPRWWSDQGGPLKLSPAYDAVIRRAALTTMQQPTSAPAQSAPADTMPADNRYTPIPGGWRIHLHADPFYKDIIERNSTRPSNGGTERAIDRDTQRLTSNAPTGLLLDNPRLHWRPLYPPGEKSLIWTDDELARTPRASFRPLILAGTVPRFLFDYHSAGGLLGHLRIGLARTGTGKWFQDWSEITVNYVDGRLKYNLHDDTFPGTSVLLEASPLANAVGLIVRVDIKGAPPDVTLVWSYGGASAYYTNYKSNSPDFIYAPSQCARNDYTIDGRSFELVRGFDKSDAIVDGEGRNVGVMHELPGWKARIRGGSSWATGVGFGSAEAFDRSPDALLQTASFTNQSQSACVVLEKVPLVAGRSEGMILVGMGFDMAGAIKQPTEAWAAAMERNAAIARRIATRTPDPELDAAMTTLAFGNEGLWASQAFVHGGWSWRSAYLGWRILYGPTVYGWTDRVRKNILNHCRLCVIPEGDDVGGISDMLERVGLYYNMNEVFFDMVRHYFDYTNDVELMKELFPVFEGAIERENRRLRPAGGALYENALNTWISDSHWYIDAQCTQASAYMLRMYEFMADIAKRIGRDDRPFREQAEKIRAAIQSLLWQKRPGVFAECLDTRGNRLLHPDPELPTIYHSAEFGAADDLQVHQMLHWADTHLRQERTPSAGRLYWSSNWFPNHGRSYTHSTYEMAYGEELNFAETNFMAGRSDVGYAILRACLSGIFNGQVPGGLSCHAYVDGTQRANWEFADAISMWGRAVVEGLFGIRVKRPDGLVLLTPGIPADWPGAAIETPHFSYQMRQGAGSLDLEWKSPVETAVRLRLPLKINASPRIRLNGQNLPCQLGKGIGFTWIEANIPKAVSGKIAVDYAPAPVTSPLAFSPAQEETLHISAPNVIIKEHIDPQGLLADARVEDGALTGRVVGDVGPGILFVSDGKQDAPRWLPISLDIRPLKPARKRTWTPPGAEDRSLDKWVLVDLSRSFNTGIPDVLKEVADGAIPPPPPTSQVGFSYWKEHMVTRCKPPCDTAWRARIGADGVAWTTDGIPFKSPRSGPNIALACLQNKTFPPAISIPVKAGGRRLYLMIGGITWPAQSHVVNLRIVLRYADGSVQKHDLVQPFDIGNCWATWCGLYFDTSGNGFENIGGRSGPAGTSVVADLSRAVAVDTIAHLIDYELPADRTLDQVEMEMIANDVAFGLMGVSVLK